MEGDATPQALLAFDCESKLTFPREGEDDEGAVPGSPWESEGEESPGARKDREGEEGEVVEASAPSPPRRCI